jgi:hypothetical protein
VRKSIAQVLTVYNQTTKAKVRLLSPFILYVRLFSNYTYFVYSFARNLLQRSFSLATSGLKRPVLFAEG